MDEARRRALMAEGQAAFNRREFYETHEIWEEVWLTLEDDDEHRWIQGLIQVATGLHKLDRGRPDVCTTLLTKGLAKLQDAPDVLDGVDVAGARRGGERILAAIARGERPSTDGVKLAVPE